MAAGSIALSFYLTGAADGAAEVVSLLADLAEHVANGTASGAVGLEALVTPAAAAAESYLAADVPVTASNPPLDASDLIIQWLRIPPTSPAWCRRPTRPRRPLAR